MESESNNTKKKVLIIGAGVAGLTAGIYGQREGFETVIFEKNPWIGGSCSGWKRGEYTIDNCLHWLTGTWQGGSDYAMWEYLGVLDKNVPVIKRNSFLSSTAGGITVNLWRDINRTRKEMLEISPEDAEEINNFLDCVEFFASLITGGMSFPEFYKTLKNFDDTRNVKRIDFTRHFFNYLGINCEQMSKRFKCEAIKCLFLDFMAKEYESYWLTLAYSFFISGNGDLPQGGSLGMVQNLKKTYLAEGGKIITNKPARQIVIDKKSKSFRDLGDVLLSGPNPKKLGKMLFHHAPSVLFEDGTEESADYIIPACDIHFTYKDLLNDRYTPPSLVTLYKHKNLQKNVIYSSFQVAYAVDGLFEEIEDTLGIECVPIQVGNSITSRFTIKNYRIYGDYIAPEGKTVIQVSVPQYISDFNLWKKLAPSVEIYHEVKTDTAMRIQREIERAFPQYKNRLKILDIWTPYSYKRLNNDYYGAYMRYITTPFSFNAFLSAQIIGLDNVFIASHCLRYPGGLPTAAYTGRDAIELIKKEEAQKKNTSFIKFPKIGKQKTKNIPMPE